MNWSDEVTPFTFVLVLLGAYWFWRIFGILANAWENRE